MTAPALLYIVMPIVVVAGMLAWLGLVFWAAAHPEWKSHQATAAPGGPPPAVLPGGRAGETSQVPAASPPRAA